jgi:GxxExxY protein
VPLAFVVENDLARQIVDAAYRVHTVLGPGLLESVYEEVLAHELRKRGLTVIQQQVIPVIYEDIRLEMGFRADLIVENLLIFEVKSIAEISPVHKKQLRTYLRLTEKRLGLLINFNVFLIKDGITRVVNGLQESRVFLFAALGRLGG